LEKSNLLKKRAELRFFHTSKISPIVAVSLCRDAGWHLQESASISWLSPRATLLLSLCWEEMQARTRVKPEHHAEMGDWLFPSPGLLTAPQPALALGTASCPP